MDLIRKEIRSERVVSAPMLAPAPRASLQGERGCRSGGLTCARPQPPPPPAPPPYDAPDLRSTNTGV